MANGMEISTETSLVVAVAALMLSACMIAILSRAASTDSRRTVAGLAMALLMICWAGAAMFAGDIPIDALRSDIGLILAFSGFAGLAGVAGLADRVRPAALILGATLCSMAVLAYYLPLHALFTPALDAISPLYAVTVIIGTAHLALLAHLAPHPARFLRDGAYRVVPGKRGFIELAIFAMLTLTLSMIAWRLHAFEGVHTVFHIYATLMAAPAAAFAALMVTRQRRRPEALYNAALAMPAGMIAIAFFGFASPSTIILVALTAGGLTALVQEALIHLRLDDPSGFTAALWAPAIVGWLLPGLVSPNLLAAKLHILGFWLAAGLGLGLLCLMLARIFTGFSISDRLREEGMDAKYAAL